ncbi:MAG: glycosyltransferase [Syntrophomonadaceae bacterium]|nr:glycosyltransferase [Syntrophomonadaceae bacterium]MDD3023681.1 glycosyltransferase [Syntrophomonadaceae bacterium]
MKILFTNTAPIIKYGIGQAFADLGHEVRFVFLDQEASLFPFIQEFRPDYVFTDGGIQRMHKIFPLLDDLKIPHIYWAIEDPVGYDNLSLPYARMSRYTFTPCQESIFDYSKQGIQANLLMFACHPAFHHGAGPNPYYNHDIIFVGNNYDYHPARITGLSNVLSPLLNALYDIRIYGNEWWLDPARAFCIPPQNYGGIMPNEDLPSACASARIFLGLHSVDNSQTMMSMRTFEIMGSGGFYLTQWTPAIEHLFINHRHLVWTKSAEETLELVNFYLAHPEARMRIARQGQQEVYEKHTYHRRIQENILPLLQSRSAYTAVFAAGSKNLRVRYSGRSFRI